MPFVNMCAERGCPEYAADGNRCVPHARTYEIARRARERNEIYKDKRWPRVRLKVLRRDMYTCQLCGRDELELGGTHNLVADHIGGDYSDPFNPETLRTLCRRCSGEQDGGRARRPAGVAADHKGA